LTLWDDDGNRLRPRLPLAAWLFAFFAFFAAHIYMFSYAHVVADTRACGFRIDDPLYHLIPLDRRFFLVTQQLYVLALSLTGAALLVQAFRGDHRPAVRVFLGLGIVAVIRSTTILLLPLCRANVEPGTIALLEVPYLDLGLFRIPWRPFARNDLFFSGHVAEMVILLRATRNWPRPARILLWVWQLTQAYALLAVRGHYTIDILMAVPYAAFADVFAVRLLTALPNSRPDPRPSDR
jgi:hypothetical protein